MRAEVPAHWQRAAVATRPGFLRSPSHSFSYFPFPKHQSSYFQARADVQATFCLKVHHCPPTLSRRGPFGEGIVHTSRPTLFLFTPRTLFAGHPSGSPQAHHSTLHALLVPCSRGREGPCECRRSALLSDSLLKIGGLAVNAGSRAAR
jgi:hypothetical protein